MRLRATICSEFGIDWFDYDRLTTAVHAELVQILMDRHKANEDRTRPGMQRMT